MKLSLTKLRYVTTTLRYDEERKNGAMETNWQRLLLDWVRCICILITSYLTCGESEEVEEIKTLIVSSAIVPQTIAVVHELWMEEYASSEVNPDQRKIIDVMLHYGASLSRTVCCVPKILA